MNQPDQIQKLSNILKTYPTESNDTIIDNIKQCLKITSEDIIVNFNPFTRVLKADIRLSDNTKLEFRVSKFKKARAEIKFKF